MRITTRRALAGLAAFAAVSSAGLISIVSPASAATLAPNAPPTAQANISPQVAGTVYANTQAIGMTLPINNDPDAVGVTACSGAGTSGYRQQSFIFSRQASTTPASLTYGVTGPVLPAGATGVTAALNSFGGGPILNVNPSASPLGRINNNYSVSLPLNIGGSPLPNGEYWIGIACSLSGNTDDYYWSAPITVTNSTGSSYNWQFGWAPAAPVLAPLTVVSPTSLGFTFTHAASTPSSTYSVSVSPAGGTVPTITGPGTYTITGLTTGTAYTVQVTATNGVSPDGVSATQTATPLPGAQPAPSLTATGGANSVAFSWTTPSGPAPTGYTLAVSSGGSPIAGSPFSIAAGTNAFTATGLTAGTQYTGVVTATYSGFDTGTPSAPASATALANTIITQTINVDRPVGALVLTQVCGVSGALPAEPGVPTQFPTPLAALSATTSANGFPVPTAPTVAGGGADPAFPLYPDTIDINANGGLGAVTANYPTNCGVDLGTGDLIVDPNSPLEGLYFAASGRLNQVTVTQTSNADVVWAVTGSMGTFTRNGSSGVGQDNSFPGSYLGWTPVVNDRSTSGSLGELSGLIPANDPDGTAATPQSWNYRQNVEAGAAVQPDIVSSDATTGTTGRGLGVSRTLARVLAVSGTGVGTGTDTQVGGLGIAKIDARLKLLIPVSADAGTYSGVLTFTVI